jgi:hypothetical protein
MNYTRDFNDYVGILKNSISNKFTFKSEKYGILFFKEGVLDKCTRILRQINEEESNIETFNNSKYCITQCLGKALPLMTLISNSVQLVQI